MQRDLVERARKGDHDAFAELAGAAISRLDAAAWLMLRDVEGAKDAVQNALLVVVSVTDDRCLAAPSALSLASRYRS